MEQQKKILFVSVFGRTEGRSNDRINNLLHYAPNENIDLITTNFSHSKKSYKGPNNDSRITFIKVPKYKRNLGLRRIISHWVFAFKLKRELKTRNGLYSHIYCVTPTPTSTIVAGNFANKNGIPFFVDIIDVWPDGLLPISGFFKVIKPLLYPWRMIFKAGIKKANYIIGANSSYTKIGNKINNKALSETHFLGISEENSLPECYISNKVDQTLDVSEPLIIAYAGSLGNLYDFDLMFKICSRIRRVQNRRVQLRFIGGGVLEEQLKLTALNFDDIEVEFSGFVDYQTLKSELKKCHIGLNIFRPNELIYMSYKLYDYLSAGLFIINNLKGDAESIMQQFNVGMNISTQLDVVDFSIENWRQTINSRNLNHVLNELNTQTIINKIYETIIE